MKPLKDRISITIDGDVLKKIKNKAEYDGRSLSQYINLVLKKHLEEEEKSSNITAAPCWGQRFFHIAGIVRRNSQIFSTSV